MVDLFKLVADRAQLHYSFLAPTSRSEYRTMLIAAVLISS